MGDVRRYVWTNPETIATIRQPRRQNRPRPTQQPSPVFLDREHSIASETYSRWLVPPAALAIHLSIGQAYAFSVFNLPLSRSIGISDSAPGDWKLSTIGWVFSVA